MSRREAGLTPRGGDSHVRVFDVPRLLCQMHTTSSTLQKGNVLLLKLAAERRRHRTASRPESWYMCDDDAPDRPAVATANLEGTRLLHADRARAAQRSQEALELQVNVWRPRVAQTTTLRQTWCEAMELAAE
eukprot:COSAG02_NODE_4788_length_4976_cov_6.285421_2_plen_132_part_00